MPVDLAGLAIALAVVATDRHALQRESVRLNNATAYAEAHACPLFVEPGQAALPSDRRPATGQPNLFEELSAAELAAVRALICAWGSAAFALVLHQPASSRLATRAAMCQK